MDIKHTEQNWRIAAQIVMRELHDRRSEVYKRISDQQGANPEYSLSSMRVVDEVELEMIGTAIRALSDILV